jgi:hypothetical protein
MDKLFTLPAYTGSVFESPICDAQEYRAEAIDCFPYYFPYYFPKLLYYF